MQLVIAEKPSVDEKHSRCIGSHRQTGTIF